MTKVRKQRQAKRFNYGANRKKINRKSKVPKVKDLSLREAWEDRKSTVQNLAEMGLVYDPNKSIPLPKAEFLANQSIPTKAEKTFIRQKMEEEVTGPLKKIFRLPKAQVETLSKLLDKYGGNYNEMAKDSSNIFQCTPKQLRQQVKQFMSIPEQWDLYMKQREEAKNDKIITPENTVPGLIERRKLKRLAKRGRKLKRDQAKHKQNVLSSENEGLATVNVGPNVSEDVDCSDSRDDHAPEKVLESSTPQVSETVRTKKKRRRNKKKKTTAENSNVTNCEENPMDSSLEPEVAPTTPLNEVEGERNEQKRSRKKRNRSKRRKSLAENPE